MRFYLLPLASAITLALNPLSVLAAEPSSAADANDQNIEKITVMGKYTVSRTIDTATGLGLSLQETPQSVSILTAERIQDQALNTVVDVVNNTVGLSSSKTDNVRNGFMARTPRGRVATAQGWRHIGRTPPAEISTLFDLPASDA